MLTVKEPIGVVGLVLPGNFSLLMAAWKLAPALAAGCSVVLKPAEQTPLTALRFAELARKAGVPAGVLNVLPGLGETTGQAIGRHNGIDAVSFTGSTEVGAMLRYAADSNMKTIGLEMGGKSPLIVLDDAVLNEYTISNMFMAACWTAARTIRREDPQEGYHAARPPLADHVALARDIDGSGPNRRMRAMLFRSQSAGVVAISQPTHAWVSGQLARAWSDRLCEPLLLAAEQHDLGWIDWETAPSFDVETGRPHLFRDVGASLHAPMWARGVDRALGAWGTHAALLISRHGGVIYKRFTSRHRLVEADAVAAQRYLDTQAPNERAWAQSLGLDEQRLSRESALIAFVDTLSLALCGELPAPLDIEAPLRDGGLRSLRLSERPGSPFDFVLSPWPLRGSSLVVEGQARALPKEGRFPDEASMKIWLLSPDRVNFTARLASS